MVCQTHNQEVCVSTGIHGGLTFGHGDLDPNGYWETDCHEAQRAHDKRERAEKKWRDEQMTKWLAKW